MARNQITTTKPRDSTTCPVARIAKEQARLIQAQDPAPNLKAGFETIIDERMDANAVTASWHIATSAEGAVFQLALIKQRHGLHRQLRDGRGR